MSTAGVPADPTRPVVALALIDAVPGLLKVLCDISGMRFAVVARAVPATIEHAWRAPRHGAPGAPSLRMVESRISVPIILADGGHFGDLRALDPSPADPGPSMSSVFEQFAALIAAQLDHRSLHEREQRALSDERAAGELREQFIAILGHDLRNPLQAVYASGDMLERKSSDPALAATASRIKTNVRRMSDLIDEVLDLARGRLGGGIGIVLTEVEDIDIGLTAVVQELRDAGRNYQIISDINVGCSVWCDLRRLQQIVSNLLHNALTHGLPFSPVKFSARADEQDLVLRVWNDGEPIPARTLDKIFEPFSRHSVSTNRDGLGLGLHICSQIVRAHSGHITVTSTREQGTEFTARVPLTIMRVPFPAWVTTVVKALEVG